MTTQRNDTDSPQPDGPQTGAQTRPDSSLVFVTVGTDVHPFARLVEWIDRWLAGPGAGSRVVVQHGTSPAPAAAEGVEGFVSLAYSDMRRYISEAAVVVCHGGPGTIMEARRLGAEPIVVPRRHDLGEHVDNHQMHFARKLAANDGLQLAEDYAAFADMLTAGVQDPTLFRIPPRPALGPGVTKFGEALAELGPRRRNRSRARRAARAGSSVRQGAGDSADPADTEVAEIFAKEAARPHPGRPPVLFVGGWGRSGSTLVDRTLGSVHGVTSLGELRDLWTRGIVENRLCGCGEPFLTCPFWTEVGERAFGGWDTLDLERLRRLRATVDRPWTLPLLIWPVLPSFRRARNEYAATLDTLLDAIASVSGASLLVESTKIATFAVLLRVTGRQVKMLHLVRDSRGVMYSWGKLVAARRRQWRRGRRPRRRSGRDHGALRRGVGIGALLGLQRLGAAGRPDATDPDALPPAAVRGLHCRPGRGSFRDPRIRRLGRAARARLRRRGTARRLPHRRWQPQSHPLGHGQGPTRRRVAAIHGVALPGPRHGTHRPDAGVVRLLARRPPSPQ